MGYPYATEEKVLATELNEIAERKQVTLEVFGEAIDGTTTPQAVAILREYVQGEGDTVADGTHTQMGRTGTDRQKRATKIRVRNAMTSTQIKMFIGRVGTPTDNFYLTIETDSSGSPSGTPVTNGTSNDVAASSLTQTDNDTGKEEVTFTFGSAFTLSANTDYWIVLQRDGSLDSSHYYNVMTHSVNYGYFTGKYYDGSAWQTSQPMTFYLTPASGSSLSVWKLDTNYQGDLSVLAGFVKSNVSSGSTGIVFTDGIIDGFSSLQRGQPYYGSDTAGSIGLTIGTYETKVGVAYSETQLKIERGVMEFIGVIALAVGGNTDLKVARAPVTYNAKIIQCRFSAISGTTHTETIRRKGHTGGGWVDGLDAITGVTTCSYSITGNTISASVAETGNNNNAALSGKVYFYR